MTVIKTWKIDRFFQRVASVILGVGLVISIALTATPAQASPDTTSAASKADAERINQRKEEAPHYPNWYRDQRSLESYMEDAGMENAAKHPKVTTNSQSDETTQDNSIDRSQQGLRDLGDTIREKLQLDTPDNNASLENVREQAGDRVENAKDTFQGATERTFRGAKETIERS